MSLFSFVSFGYPSGPVTTRVLKNLSKKAVAPVLFAAGHVRSINLRKQFQDDPSYIAEPTPDRIWYKAKE